MRLLFINLAEIVLSFFRLNSASSTRLLRSPISFSTRFMATLWLSP